MFSNDSWLSNLGSTLLQGCWFKCNYKTLLNAAEKIWVVSQLEQGAFFHLHKEKISCRPLPPVSSRGECFCPECWLFPAQGVKQLLCSMCWWGRAVPCQDLGRITQRPSWCAMCWGGAMVSDKKGWTKKGNYIYKIFIQEKGRSSARYCIFWALHVQYFFTQFLFPWLLILWEKKNCLPSLTPE